MDPDSHRWHELDEMILKALKEKPERELPLTFTDTLLRRVERKLTWRELVREFAIKTGIVAGTLLVLLTCLFLPSRETINPFLSLLLDNWKILSGAGILILFTFFSDQVLLRFYSDDKIIW